MSLWTTFHPAVFFLTFISYAFYTIVRKTPSYVQSSIISEWTPTTQHRFLGDPTLTKPYLFQDEQSAETFMGILNAIFLFLCVPGSMVGGMMADRMDHRVFLSVTMMMCAVIMFIFGPVLEWTGGYSQAAYIILQILNALFQCSCWPAVVAVMANWFDKRSRGYVLGVWSSSGSVGNVVGALVVSPVLGYGYEYAFMVTSSMLFASGVLIFFGLVSSPREVGLMMPDDDDDDHSNTEDDGDDDDGCSNGERISLLRKKTIHQKRNTPHTFHNVSTHNDKACPGKFVQTDENSDVFSSTTEGHDGTIRRFNKSFRLSNAHGAEQLAAGGFDVETNVDIEHEHKCVVVERHRSVDSKRDKQYGSSTKHQDNWNFSIKPPDEGNLFLTDISLKENLNNSSQMHDLIQTDLTENRHSDISFNNTFSTTMERNTTADPENQSGTYSKPKAISFFRALLLPGVVPYSLCYAFITFITYVFFYWLPFYLTSKYGWSEATADRLSLWFDVGGVVGAAVMAFLMSRLNKSALIMAPMLLVSIPLLCIYGALNVGQNMAVNALMLFCLGGLIVSISNVLSAAVAADLSRHSEEEAISTVTGIMEGTGITGAALGQLAVPYMKAAFGWRSIFYSLALSTFFSFVSVLPPAVSEIRCMREIRESDRIMHQRK